VNGTHNDFSETHFLHRGKLYLNTAARIHARRRRADNTKSISLAPTDWCSEETSIIKDFLEHPAWSEFLDLSDLDLIGFSPDIAAMMRKLSHFFDMYAGYERCNQPASDLQISEQTDKLQSYEFWTGPNPVLAEYHDEYQ